MANLNAAFLNQLLNNTEVKSTEKQNMQWSWNTLPPPPSVSLTPRDLVPLWDEQPQPVDSGGPGDDLSCRVDTGAAALLPSHRCRGVTPLGLLWSVASLLCLSCSRKSNTWQIRAVCCSLRRGLRGCQSAGDLNESTASHLMWDEPEVDSQSLCRIIGNKLLFSSI